MTSQTVRDEETFAGSGVHANGWEKGTRLARYHQHRARQAPDLYALFATAVYFDNWGWGQGVAEEEAHFLE